MREVEDQGKGVEDIEQEELRQEEQASGQIEETGQAEEGGDALAPGGGGNSGSEATGGKVRLAAASSHSVDLDGDRDDDGDCTSSGSEEKWGYRASRWAGGGVARAGRGGSPSAPPSSRKRVIIDDSESEPESEPKSKPDLKFASKSQTESNEVKVDGAPSSVHRTGVDGRALRAVALTRVGRAGRADGAGGVTRGRRRTSATLSSRSEGGDMESAPGGTQPIRVPKEEASSSVTGSGDVECFSSTVEEERKEGRGDGGSSVGVGECGVVMAALADSDGDGFHECGGSLEESVVESPVGAGSDEEDSEIEVGMREREARARPGGRARRGRVVESSDSSSEEDRMGGETGGRVGGATATARIGIVALGGNRGSRRHSGGRLFSKEAVAAAVASTAVVVGGGNGVSGGSGGGSGDDDYESGGDFFDEREGTAGMGVGTEASLEGGSDDDQAGNAVGSSDNDHAGCAVVRGDGQADCAVGRRDCEGDCESDDGVNSGGESGNDDESFLLSDACTARTPAVGKATLHHLPPRPSRRPRNRTRRVISDDDDDHDNIGNDDDNIGDDDDSNDNDVNDDQDVNEQITSRPGVSGRGKASPPGQDVSAEGVSSTPPPPRRRRRRARRNSRGCVGDGLDSETSPVPMPKASGSVGLSTPPAAADRKRCSSSSGFNVNTRRALSDDDDKEEKALRHAFSDGGTACHGGRNPEDLVDALASTEESEPESGLNRPAVYIEARGIRTLRRGLDVSGGGRGGALPSGGKRTEAAQPRGIKGKKSLLEVDEMVAQDVPVGVGGEVERMRARMLARARERERLSLSPSSSAAAASEGLLSCSDGSSADECRAVATPRTLDARRAPPAGGGGGRGGGVEEAARARAETEEREAETKAAKERAAKAIAAKARAAAAAAAAETRAGATNSDSGCSGSGDNFLPTPARKTGRGVVSLVPTCPPDSGVPSLPESRPRKPSRKRVGKGGTSSSAALGLAGSAMETLDGSAFFKARDRWVGGWVGGRDGGCRPALLLCCALACGGGCLNGVKGERERGVGQGGVCVLLFFARIATQQKRAAPAVSLNISTRQQLQQHPPSPPHHDHQRQHQFHHQLTKTPRTPPTPPTPTTNTHHKLHRPRPTGTPTKTTTQHHQHQRHQHQHHYETLSPIPTLQPTPQPPTPTPPALTPPTQTPPTLTPQPPTPLPPQTPPLAPPTQPPKPPINTTPNPRHLHQHPPRPTPQSLPLPLP